MILVKDIFHLKFGKAKDAKGLINESRELGKKHGFENSRVLTDLVTGQSYTLVLESQWNSLADWEGSMKKGMGDKDWQNWYQKFIPLVENASREIYNIVD